MAGPPYMGKDPGMTLIRHTGPATEETGTGYTPILSAGETPQIGLSFGTWKLEPGGSAVVCSTEQETAVLAFSGMGEMTCKDRTLQFDRRRWIDQGPAVVHCCAGGAVEVRAAGEAALEVFIVQAPNSKKFAPRYYEEKDVDIEHRGKGILEDTCHRVVRLVFDDQNGPPESELVLGEVVNFPGKWSSYPPHSHPQPEIYYYRFDPRHGWGHGELGDRVFKIHDGDLLAITDNRSHVQASAPGYSMYYLWAIRHLEGNRYKGFTFDPLHSWTLGERNKP